MIFPTGRRALLTALVAGAAGSALPFATHAQVLTLGAAVDSALATHPSLSGAAARVDAAQRSLSAAEATRLPSIALSAGLTRFDEPMIVAPFHSLDLTTPPDFDRTLVRGQIGLRHTLFDGGARSSRIRGAAAVAEAAGLSRADAIMEVLEQSTVAYLAVLSARAVESAAGRLVSALEAERSRAQQSVEVGTAAQLELLRAAAAFQDARAQNASASARVGLAERVLARVMGTEPARIAGAELAGIEATGVEAAASTSSITSSRSSPLIGRAERLVAAAEAQVSEERSRRLPTIDAAAGILDYGTAGGGHVAEWQAGFQVSWSLFTGGARNASVERAGADLRAARSDLAMAELRVANAADAAETAVLEADARAEALALSVTQWEEVARIEALALDVGSGVQSDRLRAEAGLFQARAGHTRAIHDAALARVRLARAQGILDRAWIDEALENRR